MNLIQSNIDNLTSLWQSVGKEPDRLYSGPGFQVQTATNSEWPNKLWFTQAIDQQMVKDAKTYMESSSAKLSVPYWHIEGSSAHQLLESKGFQKTTEQIGMSMQLSGSYESRSSLQVYQVSDTASAELWSALFLKAFDYNIGSDLLLPQQENTDFLIASHNGKSVGTGIIHYTEGNVAGIHSMGIVPAMRRKGFAEQMMITMLGKAGQRKATYATLQASSMGKGLYLKMGFTEDFKQINYQL